MDEARKAAADIVRACQRRDMDTAGDIIEEWAARGPLELGTVVGSIAGMVLSVPAAVASQIGGDAGAIAAAVIEGVLDEDSPLDKPAASTGTAATSDQVSDPRETVKALRILETMLSPDGHMSVAVNEATVRALATVALGVLRAMAVMNGVDDDDQAAIAEWVRTWLAEAVEGYDLHITLEEIAVEYEDPPQT